MTVVAVPFRPDNGHRDQLFTHLKHNYWTQIGFELLVGHHTTGLFNRAKAINTALDCDWDYAVIADADTWVPPTQLREAIATATATGRLVAAFNAVVELSHTSTTDILAGTTSLAGPFTADRIRTRDLETQSSMLVIGRDLWDRVGGLDEKFEGWGGEDNAFWRACALHAGEPKRITGNAYHLWHPSAPGKRGGIQYKRNLNRWRRYQRAETITELPH